MIGAARSPIDRVLQGGSSERPQNAEPQSRDSDTSAASRPGERSQSPADDPLEATGAVAVLRRLMAELIGTWALTLAGAGAAVVTAAAPGAVGETAKAAAPALTVLAMIYAIGQYSGAHFNPAVTLAFALRRDFPWRRVVPYWAAQLAGACLAALLLRALFGDAGELGMNRAHHIRDTAAMMLEAVLTFVLVLVILGTATRYSLVGPNAAIAVGGTITLCGLWALPITGASMNPARSLGPALIRGDLTGVWIYIAGPMLGALCASLITWLLCGAQHDPKEGEAAQGNKKDQEGSSTR